MTNLELVWYYAMRDLDFLKTMVSDLDAALGSKTLTLSDDEKEAVRNLLNAGCAVNDKWLTSFEILLIFASNFASYITNVDVAKAGVPPPPPPPFRPVTIGPIVS